MLVSSWLFLPLGPWGPLCVVLPVGLGGGSSGCIESGALWPLWTFLGALGNPGFMPHKSTPEDPVEGFKALVHKTLSCDIMCETKVSFSSLLN